MGYYFNLPPIISVILVIIPFTAWLCGFLSRCQEGRYIAAIIRFFFPEREYSMVEQPSSQF